MELVLVLLLAGLLIYGLYRFVLKDEKPVESSAPAEATPAVEPAKVEQPAVTLQVLDVNQDGKVNLEDVKEVAKKTRARVKKAADVDGDGKVTKKDVKAAAKKIKTRRSKS